MELQDRLNKIKAKGQSILEQKEKAEQERIEKRKGLISKITSLAPRIKKLIILGNELYKQGLLKDYDILVAHKHNDYFYTDGWLHCLGFNKAETIYKFATDNTPIKFIGIEVAVHKGFDIQNNIVEINPYDRFSFGVTNWAELKDKDLNLYAVIVDFHS